jgi:hypothetical protein
MQANQFGHESDIRYYSRRVIEERARAQQAKQPEARAAHHMLSEIYLERLESLKNGKKLFPIKDRA